MAWKAQTILVNKLDGRLLKVLFSYQGATVVVDLQDKRNPTPSSTLLERDYDHWEDQSKMVAKLKKKSLFDDNPQIEWVAA